MSIPGSSAAFKNTWNAKPRPPAAPAPGKSELLQPGEDVTILAIGKMVSYAMEVAEKLKENEINAEVINARFMKPFDEENILFIIYYV